jgi:hypothetical protein
VSLLDLLSRARAAGLTMSREDDRLVVSGPQAGEVVARELLARKSEVLRVLPVLDGTAPVLDWSDAVLSLRPAPCRGCARAAHLHDPADGNAWHKACYETALREISAGSADVLDAAS